jgi:ubiquinone/menaquinone biosynthesis C-methylase UbiE
MWLAAREPTDRGDVIEPAEKTGMRNAWGRVAVTYDQMWAERLLPYTERGLDALAPDAAADVLDVGCGPGLSAAAVARRVPHGTVTAVDFSPAMVERARERWSGVPRLTFAEDDAERLAQPDAAYDVVTSSFALMYCYDALAALGHLARVVRPGGRVMTLVWGRHDRVWWSPSIDIVESRAGYYSSVCPMMFFYGLPGVLPRMLGQVGLEVEAGLSLDAPIRFGDVDEAVACAILAGPLAGLFQNRLDDEARRSAWSEMAERVDAVATGDGAGILLPAEVLAVIARRPA